MTGKPAKRLGLKDRGFIPQGSERKGISMMVPLWSEYRESKVRYPVPWGGKGGNAS
jgi:N-acyl-D-aspartate/D-glutamate deacylase